jgi:hypothetical protein
MPGGRRIGMTAAGSLDWTADRADARPIGSDRY